MNDMCENFGIGPETIGEKFLNDEWEWMDVSIRCYLLGEAISEALDEVEEELENILSEFDFVEICKKQIEKAKRTDLSDRASREKLIASLSRKV